MKSLIFPLLGVIVTIYMPAQTGKGKLPIPFPVQNLLSSREWVMMDR
jgi:hypothetical protein